ncbi:MAG: hypothetical protein AB9846_13930 [Tenuifilaceae bacterium]
MTIKTRILLLSIPLGLCFCRNHNNQLESSNYKIIDYSYTINNYPGADGIFTKVAISDSSTFFYLLLNEDHLKFDFKGFIYGIDTLRFLHPSIGVDRLDSNLVFCQPVLPKLWNYEKEVLDSLFRLTEKELSIHVIDTTKNMTWTFENKNESKETIGKWKRYIPSHLFLDKQN